MHSPARARRGSPRCTPNPELFEEESNGLRQSVLNSWPRFCVRPDAKPSSRSAICCCAGALAGAFLGFATSLVFVVQTQGVPPIVGALLFPVGFVILVLLGLELATGNFAILPAGVAAGEVTLGRLLRNWCWVYLGNLLGSSFGYALLFYLAITNCGANNGGPVGDLVRAAAQKKTVGYLAAGGAGWATALVKAVLCNWMVTIGALMAMVSRSTIGKIVGHVAAHPDVLRPGLRALHRQHVRDSGRNAAARPGFYWKLVAVESDPGNPRQYFVGLAVHGAGAVLHAASEACAPRACDGSPADDSGAGRGIKYSKGLTTGVPYQRTL